MKIKILSIFVFLITLLLLPGCQFNSGSPFYEGVDIERFDPNLSSYGVAFYLVPEELLEEPKYVSGKFYWDTNADNFIIEDMDKMLMYLEYDKEDYNEAKSLVLSEMNLDLSSQKTYNNYCFILNLDFTPTDFPSKYNMVSYNDNKNTLLFFGMRCVESKYPDLQYAESDFGKYLQIFFGDFYDFDA